MSQSRRQADQLAAGDRFVVPLKLAFEVRTAQVVEHNVRLAITPVPCGPACPKECECDSSLLDGHAGPFQLTVDGKRKLEYLGNLSQLLATLELTQAHIERLQVNGAPGEQKDDEHSAADVSADPARPTINANER